MDNQLVQYVKSLGALTGIEESGIQDPFILRRTNAVIGLTTVIVVSINEPYLEVLPLNVVWACFDGTTNRYRKIYKRISKTPDVVAGTQHTWELLQTFPQVFENQFYAPEDESAAGEGLSFATTGRRGTIRLLEVAGDPANPIVVSDGDPRNTDPRDPLPHDELHPEKPLQAMRTVGVTNVSVGPGGFDANGTTLYATGINTAEYDQFTMANLVSELDYTTAQDPSTLTAEINFIDFFYPQYTVEDLLGMTVGSVITPLVKAFVSSGIEEIPTNTLAGYYTPTTIEHNGAVVSGANVTLVAGANVIIVRLSHGATLYSATYTIEGVV
jgi:hypothetical protein